MPAGSDPEEEEPIPLPTWARDTEPLQPIPSRSRYEPPEVVVTSRRRARSQAAWYAEAGMGHSIGLGYLVLTLVSFQDSLSRSSRRARARRNLPSLASSRAHMCR